MSAETYPTVVCSQCGTQLDDSCMLLRPPDRTTSDAREQRLALRYLDEARGVYRWWRAFAVVDGVAMVMSVVGGLSTLATGAGLMLPTTCWPTTSSGIPVVAHQVFPGLVQLVQRFTAMVGLQA